VYDDPDRGKTLGVALINFGASRNTLTVTNQYLYTYDSVPINLNGYTLPYDCTLVGITLSGQTNQTWTAEVRKNDAVGVIDSLVMPAARSAYDYTKNSDFSAGDRVQFYCNGTSVDRPLIEVFFRRRI